MDGNRDLFVLSEEDRAKLVALIARDAGKPRNTTGRSSAPPQNLDMPSGWVVRTPSTGIPAMWGPAGTGTGSWLDTSAPGTGTSVEGENCRPGTAECELYRLRQSDKWGRVYTRPRLESTGFTVTVSNPSFTAVAGNKLRLVTRDGEGGWWVGGAASGSTATEGFWARLTAKEHPAGQSIKYSFQPLLDSDTPIPISWTDGEPSTGFAYEVNNIDIPVASDMTPGTGTGTSTTEDDFPTIVWMWPSTSGTFFLFEITPRIEFVMITGDLDEDGMYEAALVRWDQENEEPTLLESGQRLIDMNSFTVP